MRISILALCLSAALAAELGAQLPAPNPSGVAMGHLHFYTKDTDAQKKFWVEVLEARETKLGDIEVFKLPGVLVMLRKAENAGGTDGSVINHVGVKVRDLAATLKRVEAAHIQIVSNTPPQAMLLAPDGVRVELTEDPAISGPTINHHIHFYGGDVLAMQKWYADTFGAIPGKRGKFDAADLPGVNLSFTPSQATLRRDQRAGLGSYWVRGARSRSVHQETGSGRGEIRRSLSKNSRAWYLVSVYDGSLGHLYRAHRRTGQAVS